MSNTNNLTKEQLLNAISQKKQYKNTQIFLNQFQSGNQQTLQPINDVLISVIKSNKVNMFSKLHALRFFKELFQTGNMVMIDSINQDVQNHIVNVAGYNKSSKEINRGQNYFIEIQKRPANIKDIKQMGNSYVLLATQIVKKLAQWYPVDQDKQKTRFVDYFQMLTKKGVTFPSKENFFKPADTQKFKKNYKIWLEKQYSQKENIQIKKQEDKNNKSIDKNQRINKQNQTCQLSKSKVSMNKEKQQDNSKEIQNKSQQLKFKSVQKKQKQEIKKQPIINQITNMQQQIKSSKLINSKVVQKQRKDDKMSQVPNELQLRTKEYQKLKNQHNTVCQKLDESSKKNMQLQKKLEELQKIVQQMKKKNQKEQINSKNIEEDFQIKQNKLKQQLFSKDKTYKQLQQKYNELSKQSKQSDGDKFSQMQKKNEQIKILKIRNEELTIQAQKYKKVIDQWKKQTQQLNKTIKTKDNQINKSQLQLKEVLQQNVIIKNKYQTLLKQQKEIVVINVKAQEIKIPELQINKENKLKSETNKLSQQQSKKSQQCEFIYQDNQQKPKVDLFKMSMSKFLESRKQQSSPNQKQIIDVKREHILSSLQNSSIKHQRKSNSIGKTQTSLNKVKQKFQQTYNSGFGRTDSLWGTGGFGVHHLKKNGIDKLKKSDQVRMVSILPFIEEYFEPINLNESFTFRSICLLKNSAQSSPIISNDLIQVRLINAPKAIIVSVRNQTDQQQKIQLSSQHPQVQILGQNTSKIVNPGAYTDFTVNARITNLNTRFPVCELQISSSETLVYDFPLPLSLFSFCKFSQLDESQRLNELGLKCYKTQRFSINKLYKSIQTCFQTLKFTSFGQKKQWFGKVNYKYIPDISLFIRIQQHKKLCTIQLDFDPESAINDAFAKVLLQNLMFLLM